MSTPLPSNEVANDILAQYEGFIHYLLKRADSTEWAKLALGGKSYAMLEEMAKDIEHARSRGERYRTLAAARTFQQDLEVAFGLVKLRIDQYREELDAAIRRVEEIADTGAFYSRLTDGQRALLSQVRAETAPIKWQSLVIPVRATAAQQGIQAMALCLQAGALAGDNVWTAQLAATWRAYETFFYFDCHRLMKIDGPRYTRQAEAVFDVINLINEQIFAERAAEEQRAREEEERAQEVQAHRSTNGYCGGTHNNDAPRYSDNNDYDFDYNPGPSYNPANGLPMMGDSGVDVHGNMFGTNWND